MTEPHNLGEAAAWFAQLRSTRDAAGDDLVRAKEALHRATERWTTAIAAHVDGESLNLLALSVVDARNLVDETRARLFAEQQTESEARRIVLGYLSRVGSHGFAEEMRRVLDSTFDFVG